MMKKHYNVKEVRIEEDFLILKIGVKEKRFSLNSISDKLKKASNKQRQDFVISPSGYGIHWPSLDEDLSIDGLLGVKHKHPKLRKQAA